VPRDNNQRDHQREGQPYQPRDQHQPASTPAIANSVRSRSFNRRPQPVIPDNVSVDRLPSFITGRSADQWRPREFEGRGGERFPRGGAGPWPASRRRGRAGHPGDDFNPGMSK